MSPADPLTLALASCTLAVVALLSGLLPASSASKVDPMLALRHE